jgi:hypothetical protein
MTQEGKNLIDAISLRPHPHIFWRYSSAILNDTNAKGVPGAGFSPIPA